MKISQRLVGLSRNLAIGVVGVEKSATPEPMCESVQVISYFHNYGYLPFKICGDCRNLPLLI